MAKINALPGAAPSAPGRRINESVNLRRRMATMKRSYTAWSCFNITMLMAQCLVPFRYFADFAWSLVYLTSLSGFFHVLFGLWALRIPGRISASAFSLITLAGWIVICTLSVNGELGRSFGNAWGWHILWIFHYIVQFFSIDLGTRSSEFVRKYAYTLILGAYAFSGVIGFLQLFKVPFAMALSLSGFFGTLFRPTGLSNYSFELGNQATIGMILIGSKLVTRSLKTWEWLAIAFFASVVLIAQYRTCYVSGILFVGGAIVLMQIKRNPSIGIAAGLSGALLMTVPFIVFPERMGYALKGFSADDITIAARQLAWNQIGPILQIRPWTGIGPDSNLMISTGYQYIDNYTWLVIDNLYLMILACYGIIGCIFFGFTVVTTLIGLALKSFHPAPGVREASAIGFLLVSSLLIVSLTGNSFVYPSVGFPLIILLAVGNPTAEEGASNPVFTSIHKMIANIGSTFRRARFDSRG